jgi:23S rRNA pseudouridine2605 synthase
MSMRQKNPQTNRNPRAKPSQKTASSAAKSSRKRTSSGKPTRKPSPKSPPATGAAERIQKILARAGLASRREAEEWISAGRVSVNGEVATLGSRASGHDQIRLDGKLIHQAPSSRAATWLCHRSPGENLVQPREEGGVETEGRDAVVERLSRRVGRRYIPVSPMPRIDGGIELLTSDGELAVRLQRAVRRMPVGFSVRIRGELTPEQIEGVLEGQLDSGDKLQVLECEASGGEGANRWYHVETIGAGGRDLRAVVERQGATVSRILRISMGGLVLERTLGRGHVRQLEEAEIQGLLAARVEEASS